MGKGREELRRKEKNVVEGKNGIKEYLNIKKSRWLNIANECI